MQCCLRLRPATRELGFQAGLVGSPRLIEQRALLGVHGLGLGAELPGLQPGELERDALDLRVAPLDGLGLRVDALALIADVSVALVELLALLSNALEHLLGRSG